MESIDFPGLEHKLFGAEGTAGLMGSSKNYTSFLADDVRKNNPYMELMGINQTYLTPVKDAHIDMDRSVWLKCWDNDILGWRSFKGKLRMTGPDYSKDRAVIIEGLLDDKFKRCWQFDGLGFRHLMADPRNDDDKGNPDKGKFLRNIFALPGQTTGSI